MKKINGWLLFLAVAFAITNLKFSSLPDERQGFTITLNGDGFSNQIFFIPEAPPGYANQYFDYKADIRAKRTWLKGYTNDNILGIDIGVPIHKTAGSFMFVQDSIPAYMGFQFEYQKKGDPSPTVYQPVNLFTQHNKLWQGGRVY